MFTQTELELIAEALDFFIRNNDGQPTTEYEELADKVVWLQEADQS